MQLFNIKNRVISHIVLLAAWVALLTLLPTVFYSIRRVWNAVPYYYLYTAVATCILFFVGNITLQKRKYVYYALFCLVAYLVCDGLDMLIIKSIAKEGRITAYISREGLKESKALFVFMMLFLSAILGSIVLHLLILSREKKELEKERLKAELSLLKSQINPHFFFNSLNSIYGMVLRNDENTADAVISLSDLMRYVIVDAKKEFVPLSKEVEYLNRYIDLQRLRMPKETRLDYEVFIDRDESIVPLLLIPFYENAFKYGVTASSETVITVRLTLNGGILKLHTHNRIFHSLEDVDGTGIGIQNVKRRLELYYADRYTLDIEADKEFYTVDLTIKLNDK